MIPDNTTATMPPFLPAAERWVRACTLWTGGKRRSVRCLTGLRASGRRSASVSIRGFRWCSGGVFTACTETTRRVLEERRLKTLRDLGAAAAEAKTAEEACAIATAVLGGNPYDLPFALLYLLDADGRQAQLAGAAGLCAGSPA